MPRRAVLTALAAVTLVSVAGIADAADRNVPPYGRGPGPNKPVIVGATGVGVAASNWAFYGGDYPSYASPAYHAQPSSVSYPSISPGTRTHILHNYYTICKKKGELELSLHFMLFVENPTCGPKRADVWRLVMSGSGTTLDWD